MAYKLLLDGKPANAAQIKAAAAEHGRWKLQQSRHQNGTSAASRHAATAATGRAQTEEEAQIGRRRAVAAIQQASDDREAEAHHRRVGAAIARDVKAERKRLRETDRATRIGSFRVKWETDAHWNWHPAARMHAQAVKSSGWRTAADGRRSVVLSVRANGLGAHRSGRRKGQGGFGGRKLRRAVRYILRPSALEAGAESVLIAALGVGTFREVTNETVLRILDIASAVEKLEAAIAGDSRHLTDTTLIIPLPAELGPAGRKDALAEIIRPFALKGLTVIAAIHAPDDHVPAGSDGAVLSELQEEAGLEHAVHRLNYHAHVLILHRQLCFTQAGEIELMPDRVAPVPDVRSLREHIANVFNMHLQRAGGTSNFTHLSAADRGLIPSKERHRGPAAAQPGPNDVGRASSSEASAIAPAEPALTVDDASSVANDKRAAAAAEVAQLPLAVQSDIVSEQSDLQISLGAEQTSKPVIAHDLAHLPAPQLAHGTGETSRVVPGEQDIWTPERAPHPLPDQSRLKEEAEDAQPTAEQQRAEAEALRNLRWRQELLRILDRNHLLYGHDAEELSNRWIYDNPADREIVHGVLADPDLTKQDRNAFSEAYRLAKMDFHDRAERARAKRDASSTKAAMSGAARSDDRRNANNANRSSDPASVPQPMANAKSVDANSISPPMSPRRPERGGFGR
jgi:hypothetical protein